MLLHLRDAGCGCSEKVTLITLSYYKTRPHNTKVFYAGEMEMERSRRIQSRAQCIKIKKGMYSYRRAIAAIVHKTIFYI